MSDSERIEALESAVQGDAIFSVNVSSTTLRAIFERIHALEANSDSAFKAYEQRVKRVWKLEEMLDEARTALTPFAEVGAQVAAIHAARPQSSYAPEQVAMQIGGASITFADLIAAADVLAVRAEAVTGGSVDGVGISEIAKGEQE